MPRPPPAETDRVPESGRVVLSNGFHRYPLSDAAGELERLGRLETLITGAYPNAFYRRLAAIPGFRGNRALERLFERDGGVSPRRVRPQNLTELLYLAATRLRDRLPPLAGWLERLRIASLHRYGRNATAAIREARRAGATIYHYRSGFGGAAADTARELGMRLLCDHTIVHPDLLDYLIDHDGRLPAAPRHTHEPFWQPILEDLERADLFLVNSDFVRETFALQGIARERVFVVCQGVDGHFARLAEEVKRPAATDGALTIAFAGTVCRRKGFHHLVEALELLDDIPWRLEVAGPLQDGLADDYAPFLRRPEVQLKGVLSRAELAAFLGRNEVFAFPSLAEGSARVVFDAMVCGCCVVTTPNSGSVVEDGISGRLVPPGDPPRLAAALRELHRRRERIAALGAQARTLVREHYRQEDFGLRLQSVYDRILEAPPDMTGGDGRDLSPPPGSRHPMPPNPLPPKR